MSKGRPYKRLCCPGITPPAGQFVAALAHTAAGPIDQLRDAAVTGRARRLESLADQARHHSEDVSAAIRALVRDFQYDALVSALPARTHDEP